MATIVNLYPLKTNEEKALMAFIIEHDKELDLMLGDEANQRDPEFMFDTRVRKAMTDKLVSIYVGEDDHPGYWPKHPGLQQQFLADVMFFPITIDGKTLDPAYVLYLRNALRDMIRLPKYTKLVTAQGVMPKYLLEVFFGVSHFDML